MIIGITEVSAIWQVQKNYKNEGSNTFVVVAESEAVPNNGKNRHLRNRIIKKISHRIWNGSERRKTICTRVEVEETVVT